MGGNFGRSSVINPHLSLPLEAVWRSRTGKGILGSAVPVGSLVIVSTTDGKIGAFSLVDGKKIWCVKTRGGFLATPVVSGGKIYVSSEYPDGTLYCLDIRRGKIVWKREIGPCRSTSTIEGGVIYTVNNTGELFAHNAVRGDILWKSDVRSFAPRSPLVRGDSLLVSSGKDTLTILSAVDGTVLADIPLSRNAYPTLTMVGPCLFYGSQTGIGVISIDRGCWSGSTMDLSKAYKFAVSEDLILVSDGVRKVSAWDTGTREVRWSQTTRGLIEANPVLFDDMGLIATLAGEITLYDIHTGEVLWERNLDVSISSCPVVKDDHLLVTTDRGDLIAFSSAGSKGSDTGSGQGE